MTSLKKLIAVLAISLPLATLAQQAAAPAADKPPLYQIYGTLNLNLQRIGAASSMAGLTNPNPPENGVQSRWAVSADSTNLGIKGTANVGLGLGVVYQCETDAKLDGTGTTSLCTRNSRVGLTNAQGGTLFYGNWDTPFKALYYGTKADDPFGSTDTYGANNILGSPGFRARSGDTTGFDIRRVNSVAYWTPKIMGISGRAQVGVDEAADARYHGSSAANPKQLDPWLWALAANFDQGPLSVGVAYEQHRDFQALQNMFYTGANPAGGAGTTLPAGAMSWSTRDTAWRISAGYEVPTPVGPLTVAGVFEQLTYTWRNTGVDQIAEYSRRAYGVSAKQRFGDHEFRARLNVADTGKCKFGMETPGAANVCPDGLGAHGYTLGYSYYLASSTQVYLFWNRIANADNATYVPGAGGSLSGAPAVVGGGAGVPPANGVAPAAANNIPAGIAAGSDPESYGLGIRYAF